MDILLIVVLAVIVGAAGWYVYKAKKSGKKCIGCPDGCSCGGKGTSLQLPQRSCRLRTAYYWEYSDPAMYRVASQGCPKAGNDWFVSRPFYGYGKNGKRWDINP